MSDVVKPSRTKNWIAVADALSASNVGRLKLASIVLAILAVAGCGAPVAATDAGGDLADAQRSDGGLPELDGAAPDASIDRMDAEPPDGSIDAAVDAPTIEPPGEEVAVVVARRGSTDLVGASFAAGAWSAVRTIGTGDINLGIGAAVLHDGSAVGVAINTGAPSTVQSSSFDGADWTTQIATTLVVDDTGVPMQSPDGNAIMPVRAANFDPIAIATYDTTSSAWLAATESTGIINDRDHQLVGPPAFALGPAGRALLAFARFDAGTTVTFRFATRTAGTWSAEAPIPGPLGTSYLVLPRIALAAASDGDPIVAVWNEGTTGGDLDSAIYSGGAWSGVTPIATDAVTGGFRPFVMITLPDDRIVLAYLATAGGSVGAVSIGFHDGTSWSAFQRVPGADVSLEQFSIGIGRGLGRAVLEVAYLGHTTRDIRHARLMDEATWTWTTPMIVDAGPYDCLAFASGP